MDAVSLEEWEEGYFEDWAGEAQQILAAKKRYESDNLGIFDVLGYVLDCFEARTDQLYAM